jgi:hypothetical protein
MRKGQRQIVNNQKLLFGHDSEKFRGAKMTPSEKLILVPELWNDLEAIPQVRFCQEIVRADRRGGHRQHQEEFTTGRVKGRDSRSLNVKRFHSQLPGEQVLPEN